MISLKRWCGRAIRNFTHTDRKLFPTAARWVGLAGIVYGALIRDPAIIYGFLGLLASPWIMSRDNDDKGS